MNGKIRIFVLLAAFQIACAQIADQPNIAVNQDRAVKTPVQESTPVPTVDKIPMIISESGRQLIYAQLIEGILDNAYKNKIKGGWKASELLFYRTETISPDGIDQIADNSEIPPTLLENFKAAQQKPEKIGSNFDLEAPVLSANGDRDLIKFFKSVKRKDTDTKAVFGFSNLGIDDNYTTALVYVEFYRPETGLTKFYYLVELEKTDRYQTKTADGMSNTVNYAEVKSQRILTID